MNKQLHNLTINTLTRSLILAALDYWPEEDERHQVAALLSELEIVQLVSVDDPDRVLYVPLALVIDQTYSLKKTIIYSGVKYKVAPYGGN